MAAGTKVVLGSRRIFDSVKSVSGCSNAIRNNASWKKFFRRSQPEAEVKDKEKVESVRKQGKWDGPTTVSRLDSLKKKTSVYCIRGYKPPSDAEERVVMTASAVVGNAVDLSFKLEDRLIKFKVLTKLIDEFDHPIPNNELSTLNTIQDVVTFFSTPVQDRSTFDNMAKLNLPKNLHIQLEPVRFDPETDTFFGGKTAFPGRPTIVSDLKYSRKFKGNSGQSRNERSVTEFEYLKQLTDDHAKLGIKFRKFS